MAVNKPKQALGENPLSKSIFTPTTSEGSKSTEDKPKDSPKAKKSRIKKEESRKKNQESSKAGQSSFLSDSDKEKVNLRLSTDTNDWLDDLIKQGKRKHGQKIPKEIWTQAALELMRALHDDWSEISSVDDLRSQIELLVLQLEAGKE